MRSADAQPLLAAPPRLRLAFRTSLGGRLTAPALRIMRISPLACSGLLAIPVAFGPE
jgi:hypothetical protein